MHRVARTPDPRCDRRGRRFRPSLSGLEERVVPSLYFQGATGITFDASGDVFVSYDSSGFFTGQQQSVAEVSSSGFLVSQSVFSTAGGSAYPGTLTTIGASASLPSPAAASDILELQPNGQLFLFDPRNTGSGQQYDSLSTYSPGASSVFDAQTGGHVDLSNQINLAGA